jgi:hypothetical protein
MGGAEGEYRGRAGVCVLLLQGDLVERVVEACRRGRGEKEKLGEGVLRLMKARKRRGQT